MTRRPSRAQLLFIGVTVFLSFTGFSLLIPVLPFLVERYVTGSSEIALTVGLLLATYAACSFLAAPALGALSDRYGRRPVLLASLAGSVVGYLLLGIGGTLWILFLGRIVDGLTGGNVGTAFAYVADVTEPADRPRYYGLLGAAAGLGFMFGPALGGYAAQAGIAAPLFVAAGVTAVNLAWGWAFVPESLAPHDRAERVRAADLNPLTQLALVLRVPSLGTLFAATFLFFVAFNGMTGSSGVYLKDVFHWSPTEIGVLLFVAGAFAAFTQGYLVRRLVPALGAERVAGLGLVVAVLGLLVAAATAAVASVPLLYAGALLFILGDGLFEPSNNGRISAAAGPTMQGRALGASQATQSVARIAGPLLANGVYVAGAALPWLVEAVLVALAAAVLLSASRRTRGTPRRTDTDPAA